MALTLSAPTAVDRRPIRSPPLSAETRIENNPVVVALRGEADASTRTEMCDVLFRVMARGAGDVLIDLADLSFMDASTGRILATAQQLLERNGRTLAVRSPSRVAQQVLHAVGMSHLIVDQTGIQR
jgi:anti-anti-sigma factor